MTKKIKEGMITILSVLVLVILLFPALPFRLGSLQSEAYAQGGGSCQCAASCTLAEADCGGSWRCVLTGFSSLCCPTKAQCPAS